MTRRNEVFELLGRRAFLFCILSSLLWRCNFKDSPADIIAKIDTTPAINLLKGEWIIERERYEGNHTDYRLRRIGNDTLDVLFVKAYDDVSLVQRYERRFPCDGDTCFLFLLWNADTAFYYRQKNFKKEFIVGEYYYRYVIEPPGLPFNREYFAQYEDSLRKVRGNNLPDLPGTLKQKTPKQQSTSDVVVALDISGWQIIRTESKEDCNELVFRKADGDTVKSILLLDCADSTQFRLYRRIFKCGTDSCYIDLSAEKDTLGYGKWTY